MLGRPHCGTGPRERSAHTAPAHILTLPSAGYVTEVNLPFLSLSFIFRKIRITILIYRVAVRVKRDIGESSRHGAGTS